MAKGRDRPQLQQTCHHHRNVVPFATGMMTIAAISQMLDPTFLIISIPLQTAECGF